MQKGWILCPEEMVQDLLARDEAQVVVWDEAKARAEAEWVGRTQQDRAEVVYARNAQR